MRSSRPTCEDPLRPSPTRHRTARLVAILSTVALLATLGSTAVAHDGHEITPAPSNLAQTPKVDTTPHKLDLTFPMADPHSGVHFSDTFLAGRSGGSRLHAATDIMAPKHRPIHAAMGGTITFAPYPEPSYGWMLRIMGDDGYRYSYVHLNNDTPERDSNGNWLDDDQGGVEHAYAPRIVEAIRDKGSARGLRIERGELIGWNGDSGNAKGVASHLHLEIHVPEKDGRESYRINPYHSLVAAKDRGDVPGATYPKPAFDGRFQDLDPKNVHAEAVERLADEGVVSECSPERYCPAKPMTRGDLAVSVAEIRGLATTAASAPDFPDVSGDDARASAIAAVDAADILNGYADGTFGPDDPLTRAQLASTLVRAFELPEASKAPPFSDVVVGRVHVDAIATTYEAGLTKGCGDGSRYCGSREVTRAEIASFLDRGRAFAEKIEDAKDADGTKDGEDGDGTKG